MGTQRSVVDVSSAQVETEIDMPAAARWRQRLWWITLAFIPSSLLVGVTTHIATDVASAPFLWAPPLMLYIGTFIIVFAKRPPISLEGSLQYLPLTVGAALLALPSVTGFPLLLSFVVHLAVLFIAALVCHGLLAKDRPEPSRLTEFYLLMSLGGVLGGAFNALLVPVIFNGVTEYPLMLFALLLVRPEARLMGQGRTRVWSAVAVTAFVAAAALRLIEGSEDQSIFVYRILLAASVIGIILGRDSRLAPAICAVSAWGVGLMANPTTGAVSERGFFGVVKVLDQGDHRLMMHGTTLHGAQYITGDDLLRPTTYYAPEAPIGQVFEQHSAPGRVGVVGLGTGSVACYAREGQTYTYYEIDPLVAKFASDPNYFTYLSDCTPDAQTVLGDGRLTLAAEPDAAFELLLIDAFSSDSVPAHLLTVEAVALYLSKLSEDGVLVMHVSNNHMALADVVARIGRDLDAPMMHQFYSEVDAGGDKYRSQSSEVVILARNEQALAKFKRDERWTVLQADDGRAWTDDYSNVIGAIWAHTF
ncbi:MAG: fused MFS/spermidine synthase, partial [Pseudomonadota bacterium]